ncbi:DUF1499 domain-containing protein [Loktanella agnita]|uniref:DUF1499 domain-containing protein n=1 Tax=Loktanella agnita TaxID=287097 RepID=UPI0039857EBB
MFTRTVAVIILLLIGTIAYVRLAPSPAERWHVSPTPAGPGDYPEAGGFRAVRRITAPRDEVMAAVEQIAKATPRTHLLAGRAAAGMMTFLTRSRIMGFPDYTTIAIVDDTLIIYGRLRFGWSDVGVNRARVESWLDALGPLTEPL